MPTTNTFISRIRETSWCCCLERSYFNLKNSHSLRSDLSVMDLGTSSTLASEKYWIFAQGEFLKWGAKYVTQADEQIEN